MNEEDHTAPPDPPEEKSEPENSSSDEIEEGRTLTILSYLLGLICLPLFLVPLIMRKNDFALFHAKQCLLIWLLTMAASVICSVTSALFCIGFMLMPLVMLFFWAFHIVGLVYAIKRERKPLPWIGEWAEDWFKGIFKV